MTYLACRQVRNIGEVPDLTARFFGFFDVYRGLALTGPVFRLTAMASWRIAKRDILKCGFAEEGGN